MGKLNTILVATTAAAALGGTVLAAASPASAATRNGVCETGEFCYYFNSNNKGSVSDFTKSVADYATKQPSCYDFKGAGAGKGGVPGPAAREGRAGQRSRSHRAVRARAPGPRRWAGAAAALRRGARRGVLRRLRRRRRVRREDRSPRWPRGSRDPRPSSL